MQRSISHSRLPKGSLTNGRVRARAVPGHTLGLCPDPREESPAALPTAPKRNSLVLSFHTLEEQRLGHFNWPAQPEAAEKSRL